MANGTGGLDPYRFARISGAALCFACVAFLVLASILRPEFHVDSTVMVPLLITGCGLLAVDLHLWGSK